MRLKNFKHYSIENFHPNKNEIDKNTKTEYNVSISGIIENQLESKMHSPIKKSYEELLKENELLSARCSELEKQIRRVNSQEKKIFSDNIPFIYSFFNSIDIPMFIKNREGTYIFVNRAFEKVLGLDKEQILGKTVFELFPTELAGIYQTKDEELYTSKNYQVYEGKIRFRDSNERSSTFHKTCIWSSETEIFGLIGIIIDKTEMENAYRLLKANESKFRMIVENSTELIGKTDCHGTLLYVSPSFCKLFGKSEDALIGTSYLALVHKDDIPSFMEVLFKIFNSPYTGYHEHRLITSIGWRWIGWSGKAIINDKGAIHSVVGVGRDITERVELQLELENAFEKEQSARQEAEAAYEEMEVTKMELETTNVELGKLLIKAEEANQVKNEFLAIMSHEIRTPLTSMLGFCYMLSMDTKLSDEQKKYIHIIYESGKKLNKILSDLLELSVIEAGKLDIDYKCFDFAALVEDVYFLCAENIERKEIEFRHNYEKNLKIVSDPMKIRQILLNLIGNAAKFTDKGFIEVKLSDNDLFIQVCITDTGIGIDNKHSEIIFEFFRQVETGNNRKYGGTGLGLAICKKLVESLGGKIWVNSELGVGSSFFFTIPKVAPETIAEANEILEPQEIPDMTKQIKFLYADDDKDIVELIEVLTENIRHPQSKIFYSGKELVAEFEKNPDYDIIILDINMPDLNGVECLRLIRNKDENVPIIALTAFATRTDNEKYLEIGFTDYIPKPIDFVEFKKILFKNTK